MVTPFTYRDGVTMLKKVDGIIRYLNRTIVPFINETNQELADKVEADINNMINVVNAAIAALEAETDTKLADMQTTVDDAIAYVNTSIANLTTYVDEQVALIIQDGIQVQDPVVAAMLNNPASQTRVAADALYISPATLNGVKDQINARSRLVIGTGNSANDRTLLNNAIIDASTHGAPLSIRGNFNLTGAAVVPTAPVIVDASDATLNQLDNLRPTIILSSDSVWRGGKIVGKGTDWVNTSAVYDASGIRIDANATNVVIDSLTVVNMSGAGIDARTSGEGLNVINCNLSGVGSTIIPAQTGQWGGGVVMFDNGRFRIVGGRIKDFAQGIVTGYVHDFFVGGGIEISSAGQHGIYFGSVQRGTVSGARIVNVPLQGIKSQMWTPENDTDLYTIGDLVIVNPGSHGILLTNVQTVSPHTLKHRRVVIHDVVLDMGSSTGDGINLRDIGSVDIHDFMIKGGNVGIRAFGSATDTSVNLRVHHGNIRNTLRSALNIVGLTDSSFTHISIIDCATLADAADKFGLILGGANSARIKIYNLDISDAAGNTQYAIYASAGDQSSYEFGFNNATGMSDYGFRSAGGAVKLWVANDLNGVSGKFFNVPANAAAIADTSGATLVALETEVNKLKQRLRDIKIVN